MCHQKSDLIHKTVLLLAERCYVLQFLASSQKLRNATISFVVSVRPSVPMEQLVSDWTDFHEIWYLRVFRNSVEKIQVSLKSGKNNRHFT
jgi:hypothetical protein